jgi:phosphate transport system substrate-binding protein
VKAVWTSIVVVALAVASCAQAPAGKRTPEWEGIAIVVNRNNPVNNVSLSQLQEIFFGDRRWWSHDQPITLLATGRGSAEREAVLRGIYKMDERDYEKYFFFEVYRGEPVKPPTTMKKAEEVNKFVSRKRGALGYIRASDVDPTVKVLRVDGLSPDDDGYPLRVPMRKAKR